MHHLEEETIVLLALGERAASEAEKQHLAECASCNDELAALERVVGVGRAGGDQPHLEQPSEEVWSQISAKLGIPGAIADGDSAMTDVDPVDDSVADTQPAGGEQGEPPSKSLRFRRGRLGWVAAAAFLIGIGAGITGDRVLSPTEPETPVLSTAQLQPEPDWAEVDDGSAALHEVDGRPVLTVELSAETDGFQEVWLIDSELEQLVSLGVLVGDEGTFDIPEGLDMEEFTIVDVSDEPFDGDPAHSGDSVVRGELS